MGTTKKAKFERDVNDIAEIFKALGHPARIQIINSLLIKNNATCGEIVTLLPLAQSTVSKHLLELKKANLVRMVNVGKKTIYSIDLEKVTALLLFLQNYILVFDKNKTTQKPVVKSIPIMDQQSRKSDLKKQNYQFPEKGSEQIN